MVAMAAWLPWLVWPDESPVTLPELGHLLYLTAQDSQTL